MRKQERQLFKNLCSFKAGTFDESLLESATPTVLGQLFFNRMQAIAYGTLKHHGLLGKVNREFRNSLKSAYEQNLEKNKSFFACVQYLNEILADCNCKYAMLKGAYLCRCYPEGYRTSNDIDLLVLPNDVTKIGEALLNAGFQQGNIRNGVFTPATRKEIITSKMMRGETIPYIKEVNLPSMQFLEVDINFSLDYKPGDTTVLEEMLKRASTWKIHGLNVTTLDDDDFLVHLCSHLYKEATTLPWVEMKRDMTLYKYCDIYMLMEDVDREEIDGFFLRAKQMGMEKVCAFAILQTGALFHFSNTYAISAACNILKDTPEFLHIIISPTNQKRYLYSEKNIAERFFAEDRKLLLEEVNTYEKT